jgi:cytochrome P450
MISGGRADMVERFAFPLPASVVFSLIGYPEEDTEMLKSWCFDRLKITWDARCRKSSCKRSRR